MPDKDTNSGLVIVSTKGLTPSSGKHLPLWKTILIVTAAAVTALVMLHYANL